MIVKSKRHLLLCIIGLFTLLNGNCQTYEKFESAQLWVPALGNNFDKALFKTSLDISKHHLTGLLFFKQTSDTTFRIIFTNEMGMKFFDLEFIKEQFVVHYCFPSLSRKSLMKIFESDFRLLLSDKISRERIINLTSENPEYLEYKVKTAHGKYFYTIDYLSRKINRILSSGKLLGKIRIFFDDTINPVPHKIHIENPAIKLTMKLTLLDN
jgi:hypothetical protein